MSKQDLFNAVYLGAPVVLLVLGWGAAWLHMRSLRHQQDAELPKR